MPRTVQQIMNGQQAAARRRRLAPLNRMLAHVEARANNPCGCAGARTPNVTTGGCIEPTTNPPSNAGLKYPFGRKLSGAQPTDLKDPFPNPSLTGRQRRELGCPSGQVVCGSSQSGDPPVCCPKPSGPYTGTWKSLYSGVNETQRIYNPGGHGGGGHVGGGGFRGGIGRGGQWGGWGRRGWGWGGGYGAWPYPGTYPWAGFGGTYPYGYGWPYPAPVVPRYTAWPWGSYTPFYLSRAAAV